MILRRYAALQGEIKDSRLVLAGGRVHTTPHGDVEIFICGRGAKEAGFKPLSWVIRVGDTWYIRPTGPKGPRRRWDLVEGKFAWTTTYETQRGQYRIRGGRWTTEVFEASPIEVNELELAEIG